MAKAQRSRKLASAPQPAPPEIARVRPTSDSLRLTAVCLVLVAAIWIAYWGVLSSDFVLLDDNSYVYENSAVQKGLNLEGAAWAFTTTAVANWHPVTWLSHMVDVQIFGLNAGRHHGMNLLLHTLNVILLLMILLDMTGAFWRSALVAALFALHPLHVESVAWIAERKDVLSTFFWFLTLWTWLAFIRSRKPGWYALSFLLLALGLMAKPMLVTLPFTLLLLDYWPLGRLTIPIGKSPVPLRRLLLEKTPLFALSAASCLVTFFSQHEAGAVVSVGLVPIGGRLANATWAYGAYLMKAIWPHPLAPIYPLPLRGHPAWQVALSAVALLAVTAACLRLRRAGPYLLFGWLWYLGTLVPVIGIVQVGGQGMADRYTYIPLLGIFAAAAWGLGALVEKGRGSRVACATACVATLLGFLVCSRVQVSYWKDSLALFGHTLAVTSDNCLAQHNLGLVLMREGRTEEAISHLREAVRLKPDYSEAHANLGCALDKMGKYSEAMDHLRISEKLQPRSPEVALNLGNLLVGEGHLDEAIAQYRRAIRLDPLSSSAHLNLGVALTKRKLLSEAEVEFREALRLKPDSADAHNNLGVALGTMGLLREAGGEFEAAVKWNPGCFSAHNNLGRILQRLGRTDESVIHYEMAIHLKPDYAEAHNNLGIALGSLGRMRESSEQFRLAIQFQPDYAEAHNNLGLNLARERRFPEALDQFREAVRIQPDYPEALSNLRKLQERRPPP